MAPGAGNAGRATSQKFSTGLIIRCLFLIRIIDNERAKPIEDMSHAV
jgi:hypothetical protein